MISDLGWIVLGAVIAVLFLERLRGPSIVAYIIAGLLMGPVFGIIDVDHNIELIAEFGIVLLLFLVGLELSLDKIKKVGKVAVIAGTIQIAVTFGGGYLIAHLLGFELSEAVILGVAFTFSSTVVVTKLLDQKGDLDTLYGRIAVGIFLVQDIVVVLALTVLAGLDTGGSGEMEGGALSLAQDIGLAAAGMGLLLVLTLAAARWVLPKPFRWAAKRPDTLFIWSLCWCFLLVYASYLLALSAEIGAFLAGLALAQLPFNEDLRRRVHPLMSFFIAVFFVTLGIQMQLEAALDYLWPALTFSVFVLVGKFVIFMIIISRMGYNEETSFATSLTVSQISEFGFIFSSLALSVGLIGDEIISLVALVGIVTIGISAYMIVFTDQIYGFVHRLGLLKIFGADSGARERAEVRHSGHIIVIGMNSLGRALVHRLVDVGQKVIAVDTDISKLEDLPCEQMLGDAMFGDVLEDAEMAHAKLVVSTLHIEDPNRLIAYRTQKDGVPTAIHAFDGSVIDNLKDLGVERLIEPRKDGVEREWRSLKASLLQKGGNHA